MLFQSNRYFRILAYTVSHNSLLLRSDMELTEEDDFPIETSFNIDIEFWAVSYISIPADLNNIEIRQINEELLPINIDKSLCNYKRKIFEFTVDNQKHYIIAGGLLIGTNQWLKEDRIYNSHRNLEHDEVIVTA